MMGDSNHWKPPPQFDKMKYINMILVAPPGPNFLISQIYLCQKSEFLIQRWKEQKMKYYFLVLGLFGGLVRAEVVYNQVQG